MLHSLRGPVFIGRPFVGSQFHVPPRLIAVRKLLCALSTTECHDRDDDATYSRIQSDMDPKLVALGFAMSLALAHLQRHFFS